MFYIKPYQWKWVCSQHPMILISRDQTSPRALETVPPWGGESIHGYCVKMYEMLKKVEDTPEMKIDFDLSAKELLLFFEEIEDGKRIMRDLIDQGRLGFVGGDYAQAHYHEARSESALRQIRIGAKIFREELGVSIDTFQHQETGLFQNLPQILRAFGVDKAAIHTFVSTFEFLDAPSLEIVSNFGRLELAHGESFALWEGLDGSRIPIYLPIVKPHLDHNAEVWDVFNRFRTDPDYEGISSAESPRAFHLYPTAYEENRGMYHNGSIIVECPDLVSLDDEYIEDRKRVGRFYRMSEALEEELKTATRMPRIRYYTYWSYCEGQFGEKMFKAYRSAEEAILRAETLSALCWLCAKESERFDADAAWDKLLTAQHHDVNWMDTDELKSWSLGLTDAASADADSFCEKAMRAICSANAGGAGDFAVVFNTLPTERKSLSCVAAPEDGSYRVFDGEKELPAQRIGDVVRFPAEMRGLGWKSFRLEKLSGEAPKREKLFAPYDFENELMTVRVLPDGRIASIRSKLSGERLNGYGNALEGMLVLKDKSARSVGNADAKTEAFLEKGPIFDIVSVAGDMGGIPYRMKIFLPRQASQRIDFDLELDFDHTALGDYYHDESKLRLKWDLNQKSQRIVVDEPYGVVEWRKERPAHPANFVAVIEDDMGLVYRHGGAPKCYVEGGTLYNVLAWGGNNFTNRDAWGWSSMDIFDMRLNGTARYQYSVAIAENGNLSRIARAVTEEITPLVATVSGASAGEKMLLTLRGDEWIATAAEQKGDQLAVRVWESSGKPAALEVETSLARAGMTDVADHPLKDADIRPFSIVELRFER